MMNMKAYTEKNFARKTASLFRALGQPARLRILLAIGQREACVCHLEAMLGLRQAYISQHLMALRDSGLVTTRRDGKYIFYRLEKPALLDLIESGARAAGVSLPAISLSGEKQDCACPSCSSLESGTITILGGLRA